MKKEKIFLLTAILGLLACAVILVVSAVNELHENPETANSASVTSYISPAADSSVIVDDPDYTAAAASVSASSILDTSSIFTDRDMVQSADLDDAQYFTVSDGGDISITSEGVYVLTGSASDVTVYVDAADTDKVQLVLDGLTLENQDFPCIYVREADKVFVTLMNDSTLSVTGEFTEDAETGTDTDGVIFSKTDLVLNGTAVLNISSTDVGIVCKDDLKITGGTYNITAQSKTIEANDSIRISDGTFTLNAGSDGMHAENDKDDTKGYIYISGGTFTINCEDDAIHATSIIQIDDGTFNIAADEGLEGTYIQINSGTIFIQASGDGINAGRKSNSYTPTIEINGGNLTIEMAAGDSDGIDSNGDLIINAGTIDITARSAFDYDGTAALNGGTVIVNGNELNSLPVQMNNMK